MDMNKIEDAEFTDIFKRNSTNQKSIQFSEQIWYEFMMLFWIIYQLFYSPTFSAFPMRI